MNLSIILIGIIVGIANFSSRFMPLWFIQKYQQHEQRRGAIWLRIALGCIGISAISAMLMVATLPPLIATPDKMIAMSLGFITLTVLYLKTRRMVMATLLAALIYGISYTYLPAMM
ncbi:L-valine transporter subunit YgaH [Serratia sp. S1B]|nr:L-valine transporter subunit YgaH [Serratia sp. S1B]